MVVLRTPKVTPTTHTRGPNDSSATVSKYIAQPAPLGVYTRAAVGPATEINVEPNVTQPVEGGKNLPRTLSPFVIRLEPPLAYASEPSLLDQREGKARPGIYDSGLRSTARSGFTSSRGYLANTTFATKNLTSLNPEAYVSTSTGEQFVRKGDDTVGDLGTGSGTATQGKPNIADLKVAADIATQLSTTMRMPPLVLLINPQSMSVSSTKVQQYSDRSREGYIYHGWGEEQVRISLSMMAGAFISGGRGVQFASKKDSASWQNFQAIYTFYKNNGYLYDRITHTNAHHFVGALSLHYDQWSYFGHFESLNFSHDESNVQGGVSFTMEFVASAVVDSGQPVVTTDTLGTVTPLRSPNPSPKLARLRRTSNRTLNLNSGIVIGRQDDPRANVVLPGAESNSITTATPTVIEGDRAQSLPRSTQGFQPPSSDEAQPALGSSRPDPFGL